MKQQRLKQPTRSKHKINGKDISTYRVSLIHPSVGINWSGGSEIFTLELTRRLSSYFEVELLGGAPCSPFFHPAGGISRNKVRQLANYSLIAKVLENFVTNPDIVIEHLSSFLPCAIHLLRNPVDLIFPCNDYGGLAVAAFVRSLIGTPILYTEHLGLLGDGRLLVRNLKFCPDHLVVFSENMVDFIKSVRPLQTTTLIPNGVDTDRFTPQGKRLDFNLSRPIILCVAFLDCTAHKRVELAIQATVRIPNASLLICGDGPDRDYFQMLGEQLLSSDRFAVRTFPYEQMPEVYRSVDIFTLPSIDEPFGLAYLEAMASGLPVVATDDEMRRYIVGDGGLVCDVTNPVTYANALVQVLSEVWGTRPRQNAFRFSWDTLALRYRDVILETIVQSKTELTS